MDERQYQLFLDSTMVKMSALGFVETLKMAETKKTISRKIFVLEEDAVLPNEILQLFQAYRDCAEIQLYKMDTTTRSRAMAGYLLLKAEAYRMGGWLMHWEEVLSEAEENAHHMQLSDELESCQVELWRLALLNIIDFYSVQCVEFSGESNADELLDTAIAALAIAGVDPDEYLPRFGLM